MANLKNKKLHIISFNDNVVGDGNKGTWTKAYWTEQGVDLVRYSLPDLALDLFAFKTRLEKSGVPRDFIEQAEQKVNALVHSEVYNTMDPPTQQKGVQRTMVKARTSLEDRVIHGDVDNAHETTPEKHDMAHLIDFNDTTMVGRKKGRWTKTYLENHCIKLRRYDEPDTKMGFEAFYALLRECKIDEFVIGEVTKKIDGILFGDVYNSMDPPNKAVDLEANVLNPKNTMHKVHEAMILSETDPHQYYFTYFYFFCGAIMEFQDTGKGFVLSLEEFYMEMDSIGLNDLERDTIWEQVLELANAYTAVADDMVAEITPIESENV